MPLRLATLAVFALLVLLGAVWLLLRQGDAPEGNAGAPLGEAVAEAPSEGALVAASEADSRAVPALRGKVASAATSSQAASPSRGPRTRLVARGFVFDRVTRRPLSGVAVTTRSGSETSSTTTDVQGIFRLEAHAWLPWTARLTLECPGYVSTGLEKFLTWVSPESQLAPLGMDPVTARLPGRVVSWEGRPVADARVRVEQSGHVYRSDRSGRFGPVPVGGRDVEWTAWAPGAAWTEDFTPLGPHVPTELLIRLVPHAYVEGRVVDEAGVPVVGAEVHARGRPEGRLVRTGRGGRFRWPLGFNHGVGLVAVSARGAGLAWGYAGLPTRIEIAEMELGTWRGRFAPSRCPPSPPDTSVEPTPLVTLRLRVVDASGSPLPWAEVLLVAPAFRQRRHANGAGRWTTRVPSRRPISVDVSHPAAASAKQTITLAAGRSHDLRVELPPRPPRSPPSWYEEDEFPDATTIRGVVRDAQGRPLPGVRVEAPPQDAGYSDEWGRWQIPGGSTGATTRLYVSADGWPPLEAVGVFGGSEVDVRLPARSAVRVRLKGRVGDVGSPEVSLVPRPDLQPELVDDESTQVFDDGDGYRIHCPIGTWSVAFRLAPGDWVVHPRVRVETGRETVLTYDFPRLGRLRLCARDPHGVPVEATVCVAETGAEIGDTEESGWLDVEEWDATERIPAGVVRLVVEAIDCVPVLTGPVDLRRSEVVDVVVRGGVRVKGIVRDGQGEAVYAQVGHVVSPDALAGVTATLHDGTFELLTGVPPGSVQLRILRDDFPPCDRTVKVPAGREEITVELRIP